MNASRPGRHRSWPLCALGGNSLIRRQDRLEAFGTLLVLALLVLAVPAAVLVGRTAAAAETERDLAHARSLNPIEATVVEVRSTATSRAPHLVRNVGVQWTQAFQKRTEYVSTTDKVRVGDRLTVWLDEAGEMAGPPKHSQHVSTAGLSAGLAVWTGTLLLTVAALALLRARLDRRRSAEWDHQWRLLSTGNGRANRDH